MTNSATRVGSIERDGVRLAYEVGGAGDRAVVLVHGMACNRSYMAPLFDHLVSSYRVVSVDLRGHGASGQGEPPYSIATFGADIVAVMDELALERPVIMGHSLGGSICLGLSAEHPERVAAQVLLDPAIQPVSTMAELYLPIYETLGGDDHAARVKPFLAGALFSADDDPVLKERVSSEMAQLPGDVFVDVGRNLVTFDSVAAVARVQAPTLLIVPPHSLSDPAILDSLPAGWHLGRVVGAGHFPQLTVPDQVNAMIDRFLALTV